MKYKHKNTNTGLYKQKNIKKVWQHHKYHKDQKDCMQHRSKNYMTNKRN